MTWIRVCESLGRTSKSSRQSSLWLLSSFSLIRIYAGLLCCLNVGFFLPSSLLASETTAQVLTPLDSTVPGAEGVESIGNFIKLDGVKKPDHEFAWVGHAAIIHLNFGGEEGEHKIRVDHNIFLTEAYRFDVIGAEDRLIGQVVSLREQDGNWTAFQTGWTRTGCGCGRDITQFSGSAVGDSDQKIVGWIYYSMTDDDPLQDILPSGSYAIKWDDISTHSSFTSARKVVQCFEPHSESQFISDNFPVIAGPTWSQSSSMPFPMLPDHDGRKITVDQLRDAFRYYSTPYHDQQSRQLVSGKMEGSYVQKIPIPADCELRHREEIQEWSVYPVIKVEPILPSSPETWRPVAEPSNALDFTVKVSESSDAKGKFRFTLFEVTQENGWAMNAGHQTDDSLDLVFMYDQDYFWPPVETVDGWVLESRGMMSEATVRVEARDYGAWGKLKCEVNTGGWWFPCVSETRERYVTIPFDRDENQIADFWELKKGISGISSADDDESPVGREPGDGFSNYEEYRGFKVKGDWTDTDPTMKDLFIHNDGGTRKTIVDAGIDLFESSSELLVHKILADEYDEDRIVNFNRGANQAITRDSRGQKGFHVVLIDDSDQDYCGRAIGKGFLGGPNVIEQIQIVNNGVCVHDEIFLSPGSRSDAGVFTPGRRLTKEQALIVNTLFPGIKFSHFPMIGIELVAHELGHGVNLWHPGSERGWCDGLTASEQGSLFSGPANNLMRYQHPRWQYVDGRCYAFPRQLDNQALTTFAKDLKGSGINAGSLRKIVTEDEKEYWLPMAGDATCAGTLISNMSLNRDQDSRIPEGC
ncbi:MAG: hypothetical protein HOB56_00665 [Proteobacteria bacterium]|nr:hypothetical protein [Pseudomonadota bacterium]MBT5190407.1 hypothetical protein [Pseudomonadota bacterium]MBT6656268.1 hypothetical protein [Pseudomonadota bacterium]MBT7111247.1 hypothetical protein [Pseudomonadota bacterium]MBT7672164.1 hypothetical protein [Pseudomonadota bacterium]